MFNKCKEIRFLKLNLLPKEAVQKQLTEQNLIIPRKGMFNTSWYMLKIKVVFLLL